MNAGRSHYLELLSDEAELLERCILPGSDSERRWLNRLAKRGIVVSPLRGMYARPSYWSALDPVERHLQCARALAAKHPTWIFSHFTAAAALGFSVPYEELNKIHRAVADPSPTSSPAIACHRNRDGACETAGGLRVTPFDRTVRDCLCSLDFAEGLALADSCCRVRDMTSTQLCELLDRCATKRTHGIVTARKSARCADGRSESGGESIARAKIIELGFMVPNLQVEIPDPMGSDRAYRVDFMWEIPGGRRIIGELDGGRKYTDPNLTGGRDAVSVLRSERLRESHLSALNIPIMRFSYEMVLDEEHFRHLLEVFEVPEVRRRAHDGLICLVKGAYTTIFGCPARYINIYPLVA